MSVRLDDVQAALQHQVAQALGALSPAMDVRPDGLADHDADEEWAEVEVQVESETATGPDRKARGSAVVTCYCKVAAGTLYRPQEVGEALRGTLEQAEVPVYGKTSGSPGVLQGILRVTAFTYQRLGESQDQIITEADLRWIER